MIRTRRIVIIAGILLAALTFGCVNEGSDILDTLKEMDVQISNTEGGFSGLLDIRFTGSCDATNYGDPGYVDIVCILHDENDNEIGRQVKRIHLNKNEQATVSFDIDVTIGEAWDGGTYGMRAENPDPD